MTSVSLSLTAANGEGVDPYNVVIGTNAPGVGDIELRVNTLNVNSLKILFLLLETLDNFVNDQNLGPATFGML